MPIPNPVFDPYYNQNRNIMYGNGFNPMQNNYYPQEQPQALPQQRQTGIPGKMVENIEVVKAADIPFDNNTYYFPKADKTEIYTKQWLQNGTTQTLVYKLNMENEEPKEDVVMTKLNAIEEQIEKLEKSLNKPITNKTISKSKKEEEAE